MKVPASGKEIDQNQATSDSANLLHIGSCRRSSFTYLLFFDDPTPRSISKPLTDLLTSILKVETQRRIVSRWSTLVIARNHGNACLFGVPLVILVRAS